MRHLRRLARSGRLGPRVARFLPDERLQRIFSFQSLYAGVPPDQALAAYGVIAYMDTVAGVFFPRGGMRQVGQALADAATAAGAQIHYGRTVTGLERSGGGPPWVPEAAVAPGAPPVAEVPSLPACPGTPPWTAVGVAVKP